MLALMLNDIKLAAAYTAKDNIAIHKQHNEIEVINLNLLFIFPSPLIILINGINVNHFINNIKIFYYNYVCYKITKIYNLSI